ncbi:MAG: BatD family protein [Anaerolineae bacterium]
MKFRRMKYAVPLLLVVAALSLATGSTVWAQNQGQGSIVADVDRTTLSTDERLTLTVVISGGVLRAPRPTLPDLVGFQLLGSSSSSQISIVNGDISSQVVYVYQLQPYQVGDLVIEPVTVTLDGQTYSTAPIGVRVTQGVGAAPAPPGSAPPSQPPEPAAELQGQDLYVEAEVDNPTPYTGQQVVYTVRLYQATSAFGQISYEAPPFTGFWSEQETSQHNYLVEVAGRVYDVTEVQTMIFPSVVGPVTIEPAGLVIPGSFFRPDQTLRTQPVSLEVHPLPPGAPTGFDGAVGQFSLTSTVDAAQGTVDEPLMWRVTLGGRGNLAILPDPVWPEVPGWRVFESTASFHTEVREGQVHGSRVYERLLVPTKAGEFTLPAVEYVYFDPADEQYHTIRTEPVPISIAPGNNGTLLTTPVVANQPEVAEQPVTDIRHLKAVPAALGRATPPVTQSALYWVAWVVPVVGAAGYFAWHHRQRFWQENAGLARNSRARRKAKKALAQARHQHQDAYEAAGRILRGYLADKLDRPVVGLTHQALTALLIERGMEADLVERVDVLLTSSEMGRFAPEAADDGHAHSLLQEAGTLIDALERDLQGVGGSR